MAASRTVVNGNCIGYDDIRSAIGGAILDRDWTAYAKGLLRAEMTKRQITYKGLVDRLSAIGVSDSEANLRNKISRGGFTASFFVQCLVAIGCNTLRLDD